MNKLRKLRGGKSHGRGERKHKSGSRGGVGNAGSFTHHICRRVYIKIKKSRYTDFQNIVDNFAKYIENKSIIFDQTTNKYIILLEKFDKIINYTQNAYATLGKNIIFKGSKRKISSKIIDKFELL